MYENSEKTGGFAHILTYKSPKTPFFSQKYLTRYTHETFFAIYMNFETHYISYYRVTVYLFKVSEVIFAPRRTD
jgi:hypothetical protein